MIFKRVWYEKNKRKESKLFFFGKNIFIPLKLVHR